MCGGDGRTIAGVLVGGMVVYLAVECTVVIGTLNDGDTEEDIMGLRRSLVVALILLRDSSPGRSPERRRLD